MKKRYAILALPFAFPYLALPAFAYNETITGGGGGGGAFAAENFGPCQATASLTGHDPGACIMAAYAAAVANGGGKVTVQPGNYPGLKTPIVFTSSYVGLECAPAGVPRDVSSIFQAATTITADPTFTGTMLTMTPAAGATSYLYGMSLKGCLFNANGTAANSIVIQSVAYAGETLDLRCEEALVACATLSTIDLAAGAGGGQGPGNQQDNISVSFKQSNNIGTGLLLTRANYIGSDIIYNNSYSNIRSITGNFNGGDGVVFAGADNLDIGTLLLFNSPIGGGGVQGGGKACVFATGGYVTPAGTVTVGSAAAIHINHSANPCLVGGWQMQFKPVYVPAGAPCAACGPATLNLTTTANGPVGSLTVNVGSTTGLGLVQDAAVTCGDSATTNRFGVLPGDHINTVAATSFVLDQPISTAMTTGAVCQVSSGVRGSAANGNYTVTYHAGTGLWDLTAPAAGHTQTGVAAVNGTVSFTDLVWMFTGTPNDGDSWTYTLTTPTRAIELDGIDTVVNGVQPGVFQYGAYGWTRARGSFYAKLFGPAGIGTPGVSLNSGGATGTGCVSFSYFAGCTGTYSASIGFSNGVAGQYGLAMGGNNNSESGQASAVGGAFANDFGLYNAIVRGGGSCNGSGSCQAFQTVLSKTGAGGSTVQLTANLGAPSATAPALNCVNLTKDNSSAAFSVTLVIQQQGGAGAAESWHNWPILLTRGAGVGSVALFAGTTPTPLNAALGGSVAATADTTNGCLKLTATLPAGGTWTATATVAGEMAN